MGTHSLGPIVHDNWMNEAKAARIATTNLRRDEKPSDWVRRLGLPEEQPRGN